MSQQEIVYYQDQSVLVTNTRAILQGKTYAMANVTSVSLGEIPANQTPGFILFGASIATFLCSLSIFSGSSLLLWIGIVCLVGFVAGFVVMLKAKRTYWVNLGSASGETHALMALNHEYVTKVVNAINQAIIARG